MADVASMSINVTHSFKPVGYGEGPLGIEAAFSGSLNEGSISASGEGVLAGFAIRGSISYSNESGLSYSVQVGAGDIAGAIEGAGAIQTSFAGVGYDSQKGYIAGADASTNVDVQNVQLEAQINLSQPRTEVTSLAQSL